MAQNGIFAQFLPYMGSVSGIRIILLNCKIALNRRIVSALSPIHRALPRSRGTLCPGGRLLPQILARLLQ
jgi:hypothetical protein